MKTTATIFFDYSSCSENVIQTEVTPKISCAAVLRGNNRQIAVGVSHPHFVSPIS
jgi:hypothetical protein